MVKSNQSDIKDVKDLRLSFKKSKSEDKFKKSFFLGYNVKEANLYIEQMEANRELEKSAFLDRIKELESLIKTLNNEKSDWETNLNQIERKIEEYEKLCEDKDMKLKQQEDNLAQYSVLVEQYEKELGEKEDAVVFLENQHLKEKLDLITKERNEYGGQCEIFKNENEFCKSKIQDLDEEVDKLNDRLSAEISTSRDKLSDLSLHITKIIESYNFLSERTITSLEDLLVFNKNCKRENDALNLTLKEKIFINYK